MSITDFKDIHKGKRCFIIGNGPSLNNTNLDLIRDEIIFCVNSYCIAGFDKFSIRPTYYCITDPRTWADHALKILSILDANGILILSGIASNAYRANKDMYDSIAKCNIVTTFEVGQMWVVNAFSKNPEQGLFNGDNIIIDICLQMAYYMGFEKVYLLGCDCDFSGEHHFDGSINRFLYHGHHAGSEDGVNWGPTFKSYEICKKTFEADGRNIINCTVGGRLEIFERKSLEEVINYG